ncbi:MAG: kinase [Proteobacteria bacterium]|nr:kinase [Pseudomonadota bacterium]
MIINRTPFRISFLGGGTDYPSWYLKHGGSVLATAINKYCYITCRTLPPFFEHRLRVVYSKMETVGSFEDIKHPAVRETMRFLNIDHGLEIHHDGDLPARSGMGSSSSFTVGLLHTLYALKGIMPSKEQLALESIHIEQEMIKETVGSQDQMSVAYGGLNKINFSKDGKIDVMPLTLTAERMEEFNSHLMLFYTGIKRTASDVAKSYVDDLAKKEDSMFRLTEMVDEGLKILQDGSDLSAFGALLDESWEIKKSLSGEVTNPRLDDLYDRAIKSGAAGGKITGAGGGGLMLLLVPPKQQAAVREALSEQLHVPFRFESKGSRIIFYEAAREDFSDAEKDRDGRNIKAFTELAEVKKDS